LSKTKKLVCVVDDDQSVRRGLGRLFKSAGYAAETFASAEDYLAREIFEGPICLVLDVRMPGVNGPDLQEVLESRGACEQIVFITGHADVPTATQAMKNGAVDFLLKPFDDGELIESIEGVLTAQLEHHLDRRLKSLAFLHQMRSMTNFTSPPRGEVGPARSARPGGE